MRRFGILYKLKTISLVTTVGSGIFAGICFYKGNEHFYNSILMPATHFFIPPEKAHNLAVFACKHKLFNLSHRRNPKNTKIKVFDLNFENPIGIAAGFDKHGECVEGLNKIGFGFVEIGSVTPEPQTGNDKPRVFRLPEDKAIINRYGFNSVGHEIVQNRLSSLRTEKEYKGIIGVNLGKNKTSNAISDYVQGIQAFSPFADYLVINVSSPNTPGLRQLQNKYDLRILLRTVVKTRDSMPRKVPILLKLAPDLTFDEKTAIAEVLKEDECRIDGLIISNTTIERKDLKNNDYHNEIGGLSGGPLKIKSTKMIAQMYKLTNGEIPIIGVGGVYNGWDAYEKIIAGASLIQIYSSFAYHGPPIINKIKLELSQILKENGYNSITEAIGQNCDMIRNM